MGRFKAAISALLEDTDWTVFNATDGVIYTLETFNLGTEADTLLCIYDETGTQQLFCDDDSGAGDGLRIVWQAPTSGTYTVQVKDQDPDCCWAEHTHYDLRLISGLCILDNAEPDNSQATACRINANGTLYSRIDVFYRRLWIGYT